MVQYPQVRAIILDRETLQTSWMGIVYLIPPKMPVSTSNQQHRKQIHRNCRVVETPRLLLHLLSRTPQQFGLPHMMVIHRSLKFNSRVGMGQGG